MLKIDLITVGKLKEDYLRRACEEYAKRLAPVTTALTRLTSGAVLQS